MVTRIHFDNAEDADATSEAIAEAGFEVALIKERFAGEDDDEEIAFVVATPASEAEVSGLIVGEHFLEVD